MMTKNLTEILKTISGNMISNKLQLAAVRGSWQPSGACCKMSLRSAKGGGGRLRCCGDVDKLCWRWGGGGIRRGIEAFGLGGGG